MSNEVYEFLLSLSAAHYRAGLEDAGKATLKFRNETKSQLESVRGYFGSTANNIGQFTLGYVKNLNLANGATQTFAKNTMLSLAAVDKAYGSLARDIETKIIAMTNRLGGFSTAMVTLNNTATTELKGIAASMVSSAAGNDAYANSLKSMSASARNATSALKALNTQQASAVAGAVIPPAAQGSSPSAGTVLAGAAAGGGVAGAVKSELEIATKELKQFQTRMNEVTAGANQLATSAFTVLTGVGLSIALPGKAFGDYEKVINRFKSVTMDAGKSASQAAVELEQLKKLTFELGTTTQFSAKAVGLAAVELGKLGYSAAQSVAVLPGVLNAATAGQVELAKAAEYVTAALNGFQLISGKNVDVMKQSTHVADLFAKAAAMSAIDFTDLGETFKYVSSIANSSGQSIEDMTALIGIMGQNMIKGSQAGTSLRQSLLALQRPTKVAREVFDILKINPLDGKGELKRLPMFLREFRNSLVGVEEATKNAAVSAVFGREALSGVLAIMNASDENFNKFINGMHDADGAAKDMAKIAFQGLNAEMTKLMATLETVGIAWGEQFAGPITDAAKEVKEFIKATDGIPDVMKKSIGGTLIFLGKIALLIMALAGAKAGVGFLLGGIVRLIGAQNLAAIKTGLMTAALRAQYAVLNLTQSATLANVGAFTSFQLAGVGAANATKGALVSMLATIGLVATALGAAIALALKLKADIEETKNNEVIDAELTKTTKIQEEGVKAYNNLRAKVSKKENANKTIQQLLIEGQVTTEELNNAAYGAQNMANQAGKNGNTGNKAEFQQVSDFWRKTAKDYGTQKAEYDQLLALQEEYLGKVREVNNEQFSADKTRKLAEIAELKKTLPAKIAAAKAKGFNIQNLDYLEQRQKEIDASIGDPLKEATKKGGHGDDSSKEDKVLKALNKKLDLQLRTNDAALKNLDIERDQIMLQIDKTDALDDYNKALEHGEKFNLKDNAPGRMTSPYGYRIHPIFGDRRMHNGNDYGATMGQPIKSQSAGTVAFAGNYGGYGKTVVVDAGNGNYILYAHNSKLTKSIGDSVKKGEQIALAGSTGNSTGVHSHQEVRKGKSGLRGQTGDFSLLESGARITDPNGEFTAGATTGIDPEKLKKRSNKIKEMIAGLQNLKKEFANYPNEMAKIDQQIEALRKKMGDDEDKFIDQLAEQEEARIKKIQETQKELTEKIVKFHKELGESSKELNNQLRQQLMTDGEKALDDASIGILKVEEKIAELETAVKEADITEPFREQALHDIEHFTDAVNEMITVYSQFLARSDFSNAPSQQRTDMFDQMSTYQAMIEQRKSQIANAQAEFNAFGPGGLQRDDNEAKQKALQANIEQWNNELNGYQNHLEDLSKARAKSFQDEKEANDIQFQKLDEQKKDQWRQEQIKKQMQELESGPKGNFDEKGNMYSFSVTDTNKITQMLKARSVYLAQQLSDLNANTEDKSNADYLSKSEDIKEEIAKITADILYLDSGIAQENAVIAGNIMLQNDRLKVQLNMVKTAASIFSAAGQFFSSMKVKGANEFGQALSFIGESADVAMKVVDNFKDKDWVSAAIASSLEILPMIAKGLQLFPDQAAIEKEALEFKNLVLDADLAVERARLEARKVAGQEGTQQYYDALKAVEEKEHQLSLGRIRQQTLEKVEASKGLFDYMNSFMIGITGGKLDEYGFGQGNMPKAVQQIIEAGNANAEAEKIRAENARIQNAVSNIDSRTNLLNKDLDNSVGLGKQLGLDYMSLNPGAKRVTKLALGETAKTIEDNLKALEEKIRNENGANFQKMLAGGMSPEQFDAAQDELVTRMAQAQQDATEKTKQYNQGLLDLADENRAAQIELYETGLNKRLTLEEDSTRKELRSTRDRMAILKSYGMQESEEYQALKTKEELALAASNKRKLEIQQEYQNQMRDLAMQLTEANAALTGTQSDDFRANMDRQLFDLKKWKDQMDKDFPESKERIGQIYKAKRTEIKLNRNQQEREYEAQIAAEFRVMLAAEAEATESKVDDIKQEYINAIAEIDSQEKLALANHNLRLDQKKTATRKAVADRIKAERQMQEKIKSLAIDEFNMLKKIREMQFQAATKDRMETIRGFQADLNTLDISIRKQELAMNRIKQAGEAQKVGLNEQDLQRFELAQSGVNIDDQVRKALLFNDVNLTGNANDAAARQTQQEAMDAYAEFLTQKAETDRLLKVITGPQMTEQMKNIALMQAVFAQQQIVKVNDYYNAQISSMQAAGSSAEEIDIHNRKRDKEVEALRKKYGESFERYKDLEIQTVDEQVAKDTEAMKTQLENDRLRRESIALNLEEQQIAVDALRFKYEADLQKIEDAITKLENKHLGMDTTFKALSKTMETSVTSAIDKVIDRYNKLTAAAKAAAAAGASGVGGTGTTSGGVSLSMPKIADTGQSSSTMSAKGYYVSDGDYWYATSTDMQNAAKYGLKDGAVMPDRPWLRGKDAIGPFMLDEGEEVVKRSDRMSIMDYIRSQPERLSQIASMDNSRVDRSLAVYNTLNNKSDIDLLMNRLEDWYKGKEVKGVNSYGYLSR